MRPTKNCLIAISEHPFFVVDIDEIEVVHFELVIYGKKNFDMAIIFKDFVTYKRINAIPIEHMEDIKSYLDTIGIIYSESVSPMNWTNVLLQIREEFESFLEEGGWKFLQDDVSKSKHKSIYRETKKKAKMSLRKAMNLSTKSLERMKKISIQKVTILMTTMMIYRSRKTQVKVFLTKVCLGMRWRKELRRKIEEPQLEDRQKMSLLLSIRRNQTADELV